MYYLTVFVFAWGALCLSIAFEVFTYYRPFSRPWVATLLRDGVRAGITCLALLALLLASDVPWLIIGVPPLIFVANDVPWLIIAVPILMLVASDVPYVVAQRRRQRAIAERNRDIMNHLTGSY